MDLIEGTAALELEWVGSRSFDTAKHLFRRYADQRVSFTDCTSFVVMRELDLTEVLSRTSTSASPASSPFLHLGIDGTSECAGSPPQK